MDVNEIAKLITVIILFLQIIIFSILYKVKKLERFNGYFYLECTLSILCCFAFFCFDTLLFKVEHSASFYYTELGIYLGIELIGFLIMFFIKKFKTNNQD